MSAAACRGLQRYWAALGLDASAIDDARAALARALQEIRT